MMTPEGRKEGRKEGTRKCNKVGLAKYGRADDVTDRRGREGGEGFMPHIKQLSSAAAAENYVTASLAMPLFRVAKLDGKMMDPPTRKRN